MISPKENHSSSWTNQKRCTNSARWRSRKTKPTAFSARPNRTENVQLNQRGILRGSVYGRTLTLAKWDPVWIVRLPFCYSMITSSQTPNTSTNTLRVYRSLKVILMPKTANHNLTSGNNPRIRTISTNWNGPNAKYPNGDSEKSTQMENTSVQF